jgi:hypothetical protein
MNQHPQQSVAGAPQPRPYTNVILTVIAGLLAVVAFDPGRGAPVAISEAQAQPAQPDSDENARVSAAEQRKVIIAELRALSSRVERVESTLNRGLSVRVTEMPPLQLPEEKKTPEKGRK